MGWLGPGEIIVIIILVLVFWGPGKIPELGKTLGRGIQELKKFSNPSIFDAEKSKALPDSPDPSLQDGSAEVSPASPQEEKVNTPQDTAPTDQKNNSAEK